MCISKSVGRDASNQFEDVKVIQVLLKLNDANLDLALDGKYGEKTGLAIEAFQRLSMGQGAPDGRIDPGGETIKALLAGIPAGLSETKLTGIIPHASSANVSRFFPALLPAMLAYEINTSLRQAHFLAQIAHESGALRYTEEIASGESYEGRRDLGNTTSGDGRRFKGRGLIQLTGRSNYEKYGAAKGRDFTNGDNPSLVATDPALAIDVACWFWKSKGLNSLADADDPRAVTNRINGGLNGYPDRLAYLSRAKAFLSVA